MMTSIYLRLLVIFTMVSFVDSVLQYALSCKWANEGCHSDNQCCSRRCFQEHPGTNPRCTTTDLGGLCLFSFHCGQNMQCGTRHKCCAIHWGTCSEDKDCCQKYHKCMDTKGFVYRKCRKQNPALLPKARGATTTRRYSIIITTVMSTLVHIASS